MRILVCLTVVLAFALADSRSAQATEGPWCLHTRDQDQNCSIPTFDQCVADILPFNGYCWRNPNYHGSERAPRRSKEVRTRKSRSY
jgi:hypothetical protein